MEIIKNLKPQPVWHCGTAGLCFLMDDGFSISIFEPYNFYKGQVTYARSITWDSTWESECEVQAAVLYRKQFLLFSIDYLRKLGSENFTF